MFPAEQQLWELLEYRFKVTYIQAMRSEEATTWQLLIAARQVCSTVQGIHLSKNSRFKRLTNNFSMTEHNFYHDNKVDKMQQVSTNLYRIQEKQSALLEPILDRTFNLKNIF